MAFRNLIFVALAGLLAWETAGAQSWRPLYGPGIPADRVAWSPTSGFAAVTHSFDYGPGGKAFLYDETLERWRPTTDTGLAPYDLFAGWDGRFLMPGMVFESNTPGEIYQFGQHASAGRSFAVFTDRIPRTILQTGASRYWIGTDRGVMETTDGGASWSQVGPDTWDAWNLEVVGERLAVGTETGLVLLEGDGKWFPVGGAELVIYDQQKTAAGGLLVATTGGLHVLDEESRTLVPAGWDGLVPGYLALEESGRLWMAAYEGTNPRVYGLWHSDDDGASWQPEPGFAGRFVAELTTGDGRLVVSGSGVDGVAVRSPDGTWSYGGVPNSSIQQITIAPDGSIVATHGRYGPGAVVVSRDGGDSWQTLCPGSAHLVTRTGTILVGAHRYLREYATDGALLGEASWPTSISVRWLAEDLEGWVYAGGIGTPVFRTSDRGATWLPVTGSDPRIYGGVMAPDGSMWFHSRTTLYRSADHGASIERLPTGTIDVEELLITSRYQIYARGGTKMYYVHRSGFAEPLSSNFRYYGLGEAPDGSIIATSRTAWIRSADGGRTWHETYAGFDATTWAIDPDGFAYVGTRGSSMEKSTGSVVATGTGIETPGRPRAERLSIYPNPAADLAHVEAEMGGTGGAAFEVFDALGRRVRSGRAEGSGEVVRTTILTRGLAPGPYRIVLRRGGEMRSGSLLVAPGG